MKNNNKSIEGERRSEIVVLGRRGALVGLNKTQREREKDRSSKKNVKTERSSCALSLPVPSSCRQQVLRFGPLQTAAAGRQRSIRDDWAEGQDQKPTDKDRGGSFVNKQTTVHTSTLHCYTPQPL